MVGCHIHSYPFSANHYNVAVSSASAGVLPIIAVDRKAANPLHKQIYDGYRAAILRGDLRPNQRIPSSRELASELRVSRFPVLNAYVDVEAEDEV